MSSAGKCRPPERTSRRRLLWLSAVLLAVVLGLYAQVVRFEFVSFDDPVYTTRNEQVRQGLSWAGVGWAFRTAHGANWFPLTWLSHMLDFELYGSWPGGHHLTNALLHALNSWLLFWLLVRATQRALPSAAVALLFGIHPLNVESVAWVAERKSVLSVAFGLLSLHAYLGYARCGGAWRYGASAVLLALGLMAKPMLVTLPLLMLLLDFWPLGRIPARVGRIDGARRATRLLCEKLPLLALSLLSSVATLAVQQGAMEPANQVSFTERAANALVSYAWYLGKAIWPSQLALHYQHPGLSGGTPLSGPIVAASALLLLAVSLAVLFARRRYALVGWLWFLGTLVPMIGLVQVGAQARADRYAYLPLIGLLVAVVWLVAELAARWRPARTLAALALTVATLGLGTRAVFQISAWRDSVTLYTHGVRSNPGSAVLHGKLGNELLLRGAIDAAVAHQREALRLDPSFPEARSGLVASWIRQRRFDEALDHLREAERVQPASAEVQFELGRVYEARGEPERALRHYERVLELRGDGDALVWRALARVHAKAGRRDQARIAVARARAATREATLAAALRRSLGGAR